MKALSGKAMPEISRFLGIVIWGSMHRDELLENWTELSTTGQFHKIEPLA
ncbi:MAG: hypothetical protein NTW01_00585 [Gammaproteobacteria bacterium]|nr:hypothetical protein [Gammaproteobacteria bacterium]